jgi:hypothetical protein
MISFESITPAMTCINTATIKTLIVLFSIVWVSCETKKEKQPPDWENAAWQEFSDEISIAIDGGKPYEKTKIPQSINYKLIWMSKPQKDTLHEQLDELIEKGLHTADSLLELVDNRSLEGYIRLNYRMILEEEGQIKIIVSKGNNQKDPDDTIIAREMSWLKSFPGVSAVRFISREPWRAEFVRDHPDSDTFGHTPENNLMPPGYDFMLSTKGLTEKKLKAFNAQVESGFEYSTRVSPSAWFSDAYTYVYKFSRK